MLDFIQLLNNFNFLENSSKELKKQIVLLKRYSFEVNTSNESFYQWMVENNHSVGNLQNQFGNWIAHQIQQQVDKSGSGIVVYFNQREHLWTDHSALRADKGKMFAPKWINRFENLENLLQWGEK